jgi:hypothetical protein
VDTRVAADEDWPGIYSCYSQIMAEGRTYAFPERLGLHRPDHGLVGLHLMYRRL